MSGALFRLHALPGTGKLGVATSRTIGNKPRRHKVRRRALEAFNGLGVEAKALDLIIVCHRNADGAPFEKIKSELKQQMEAMSLRWEEKLESGS